MGMTSFGWGQRACLGQSVTRDETFVATGGLLWAFNLVKKRDASGNPIEPSITASNSLLIVKPDAFEMAFEPRSAERRAEIVSQWEETDSKDQTDRAAFAKAAREAGLATPIVA